MILRYAYEDPLTKGAYYARFCVEMNQKRDKGFIISMDITNFNNINIAAGKIAGDRMIGYKNGETLLYYVISMGQRLGLHITAEGVENKIQLEFLKVNHCDDIQGFLFSKPLPAVEFEKILTDS